MASLYNPNPFGSLAPSVKRKAYFAFHFDDIMRVNNVRNAWKITHPDGALNRSFYDSSLWESKKLEGDEALKRLIREGVGYTSAVCVLVGTETWSRRWVKYEIARAVVDGRGLLAVHINGLNHHVRRVADDNGLNPLYTMGVYKSAEGQFRLCEQKLVPNPTTGKYEWEWHAYQDYTLAVSVPKGLPAPATINSIVRLSQGAAEYDYVAHQGHKSIGGWIDKAAQVVGR